MWAAIHGDLARFLSIALVRERGLLVDPRSLDLAAARSPRFGEQGLRGRKPRRLVVAPEAVAQRLHSRVERASDELHASARKTWGARRAFWPPQSHCRIASRYRPRPGVSAPAT